MISSNGREAIKTRSGTMRRHFVHKPSPAYPRSCFAGLQSAFCGTQIWENFSGGALIGQSPLFVDKTLSCEHTVFGT